MLFLVRTPTRVFHQPRLPASVECASRRSIAATIRHDAAYDHSFHLLFLQQARQVCIDECVICILWYYCLSFCLFLDLRYEFPVVASRGDRIVRTPFPHQLVLERRGEFGAGVTMLGEEERKGVVLEVSDEGEDVGEGGCRHGEEYMLHVDY